MSKNLPILFNRFMRNRLLIKEQTIRLKGSDGEVIDTDGDM